MLRLPTYSIGIGDRFGSEGVAQLRALETARSEGIEVAPVWNKSHREHGIVGTSPADVRREADEAVAATGWTDRYFVDADHIRRETVEPFVEASDFFTLDVAEALGTPVTEDEALAFADRNAAFRGEIALPGLEAPLVLTRERFAEAARGCLNAVREAGKIYRFLEERKGEGRFVTEVSMDETERPQTPTELLVILAALAEEKVPVQTIAPKFQGRFNKGVDYVGSVSGFTTEFAADVAVCAYAREHMDLPDTLKLSVHSGSDKFSLYGPMRQILKNTGAGLHLKTAGTTWLEEIIGLAEAGGDGLALAKAIYAEALEHFDALCAPYATVIDIDPDRLPPAADVRAWEAGAFVAALRHDPSNPSFNPHLRQLLHVGYKIAAQMGSRFADALETHRDAIARNVTANLLERHIRPLFPGRAG